jgi:hypothetical protein
MNKFFRLFSKKKRLTTQGTPQLKLTPGIMNIVVAKKQNLSEETNKQGLQYKTKRKRQLL